MSEGSLSDKAQKGLASAAGAGVGAALTATGVGSSIAGVASNVTTKALGSAKAKKWIALTLIAASLPQIFVLGFALVVPLVVVPAIVPSITEAKAAAKNVCVSTPGGVPTDVSGDYTDLMAWNYFTQLGLSDIHTAAILGNLYRESKLNPFLQETGGGGYGLIQWTDAERKDPLMARVRALGSKFDSSVSVAGATGFPDGITGEDARLMMKTQLDYMAEEFQGHEKTAYQKLLATTTIEDATQAWNRYYERSGDFYGSSARQVEARRQRLAAAKFYFDIFSAKKDPVAAWNEHKPEANNGSWMRAHFGGATGASSTGATTAGQAVVSDYAKGPSASTAPAASAAAKEQQQSVGRVFSGCNIPGASGGISGEFQSATDYDSLPRFTPFQGCTDAAPIYGPMGPGGVNGNIPESALCSTPLAYDSINRLQGRANSALWAMNQEFKNTFGRDLRVSSTYRSYARQVQTKKEKGYWAATPGYSNHGFGLAIDVSASPQEKRWIQKNGPRFGWWHPLWARPNGRKPENWHYEYGTWLVEPKYKGMDPSLISY